MSAALSLVYIFLTMFLLSFDIRKIRLAWDFSERNYCAFLGVTVQEFQFGLTLCNVRLCPLYGPIKNTFQRHRRAIKAVTENVTAII